MSRPSAFSFVSRASSVPAGNSVKSEPIDPVASIEAKQRQILAELNILSRKSVSLSHSLREVAEEISRLIAAQNDLCERELFEEAEVLNSALSDCRRKQEHLTSEIARIPGRVHASRQELTELARQLSAASERSLAEFERQLARQEVERPVVEAEAVALEEKLEAERKMIAGENDRLAVQEEDVRAKRDSLNGKQKSVSLKIEAATLDLREKCGNLLKAKSETDARIKALELQLLKERKLQDSQDLEISSVEKEIKAIEGKHAPELATFDSEKISVESAEQELQLRRNLLLKDEAQLKARQTRLATDQVQRGENTKWLKEQIEKMLAIHRVSGELCDMRAHLAKELGASSGFVQTAQESAEAINEDILALTACIEEKEAENLMLKTKLIDARDKIPVLEGQKKVAIQARAFKEAKDITDEIKMFSDQMQALDASAATVRAELTSLRETLTQKTTLQENTAAQLMKAAVAVDAVHKDTLVEYIAHLKTLCSDKHVDSIISHEIETCQSMLSDTMEKLGLKQVISQDPLSVTSVSSLELPESNDASPEQVAQDTSPQAFVE